jgi:hypothetical protein
MTHFTTYAILPRTLSRAHADEPNDDGCLGGRIEDTLNAMLAPRERVSTRVLLRRVRPAASRPLLLRAPVG